MLGKEACLLIEHEILFISHLDFKELGCHLKYFIIFEDMNSLAETSVSNPVEQASSSGTANIKTSRLYVCYVCSKMFSQKFNLKQHLKIHSGEKPFKCEVCSKAFQRKSNLKRHKMRHDKKISFFCGNCEKFFSREDSLKYHMRGVPCPECCEIFCTKSELKVHLKEEHATSMKDEQVPLDNPYSDLVSQHKRKNALDVFSTITFDCSDDNALDIFSFLNSLRLSIEYELKYQLHEKKCFKWSLMLELLLTPTFQDGQDECFSLCLDSNTVPIFNEDEVAECIDIAFGEIMTEFEEFFEFELFWTVTKICTLDVLTAKFNPF